MEHLFCEASSLSEGGLTILKTLGAIAIAAVLLYVILLLVRVLGGKLERRSYERYAAHSRQNGVEPLDYATYVEQRAKGQKVVWRRDEGNHTASAPSTTGNTDATTNATTTPADTQSAATTQDNQTAKTAPSDELPTENTATPSLDEDNK